MTPLVPTTAYIVPSEEESFEEESEEEALDVAAACSDVGVEVAAACVLDASALMVKMYDGLESLFGTAVDVGVDAAVVCAVVCATALVVAATWVDMAAEESPEVSE